MIVHTPLLCFIAQHSTTSSSLANPVGAADDHDLPRRRCLRSHHINLKARKRYPELDRTRYLRSHMDKTDIYLLSSTFSTIEAIVTARI
ncbi:hypothetical protein B0H12DRAFT_131207 [Mycena haematopus]|nr:hypothetical protein B0H12DRAFT_131207 [Mycena haematopus]